MTKASCEGGKGRVNLKRLVKGNPACEAKAMSDQLIERLGIEEGEVVHERIGYL